MTNIDKINAIQAIRGVFHREDEYYKLLEDMGDLKTNYRDYMTSDFIDCDVELKRLEEADYELCTALFTMLLREDHFSNGSLCRRYESGQLDAVLCKMIKELDS